MTTKTEKRIAWAALIGILTLMFALSNARAQVPISTLPAASALGGTEAMPVVQGVTTVKTTPAAVATYINGITNIWTGANTFNNALVTLGTTSTASLVGAQAANTTAAGAPMTIQAGPGGSTSGTGGSLLLRGGTATDGIGGAVTTAGGAGVGTNRAGGANTVVGGAGIGSGAGGVVQVTGGAGGATGAGAAVTVSGGAGGATSGASGAATLTAGTPTDGNGGSVSVTAAAGVGTNRNGGNVNITTGAATGSGTAGVVNLNGAFFAGASGSYTGTATGMTTSPTVTITYRSAGGMIVLCTSAALSGTSNSTAFTITGGPAAVQPGTSVSTTLGNGVDNTSTNGWINGVMGTNGTLTLSFQNGAFTSSGTKTYSPSCIWYPK